MLHLAGYVPRYKISIKFRLTDLMYVETDLPAAQLFQGTPQLVNSLSASSNDDPWFASMDSDDRIIRPSLNVYSGDPGLIRLVHD
jgi:hypothetical protein